MHVGIMELWNYEKNWIRKYLLDTSETLALAMIVRHFKIVYKVDEQKKEIRILQIFDTYQSTTRLRR